MSTPDRVPPSVDRRWFLAAGAMTVLAACGSATTTTEGSSDAGSSSTSAPTAPSSAAGAPGPSGPAPTSTSVPTTGATSTSSAAKAAKFSVRGSSSTDVALTFHTNGDLAQVKAVLDIVEKRGAVLTAFIVGNWLDTNPSMGRRLLDGRHELANHTYTHPTFEQLSPAAMATEITKCRDAITKVSGSGGRFFRLSGTDDGTAAPSPAALAAAAKAGYEVAGFDVDPLDYKDPGSKAVVDRTLETVKGGSIISLHMGHAGTIDAMGRILDGLAAKNLRPVTLSALLAG